MFGEMGARLQNLDAAVRRSMAERALTARQQQVQSIRDDLAGRMGGASPDVAAVAAALADKGRLGGAPEDYLGVLQSQAASMQGEKEALYQRAASVSKPNLQVRLNDLLAGSDASSRAAQVATYGAVGAGGVAGLTAAGQGLMALMEYIQQGLASQDERKEPLA
jgi:hypothetical protein